MYDFIIKKNSEKYSNENKKKKINIYTKKWPIL